MLRYSFCELNGNHYAQRHNKKLTAKHGSRKKTNFLP